MRSLLPTEGSLENLEVLDQNRPAVAFIQYDVALASFAYSSRAVYRGRIARLPGEPADSVDIRQVNSIKHIASLRDEVLYVLARKDKTPATFSDLGDRMRSMFGGKATVSPLNEWLKKNHTLKIGLGPLRSGSYELSRAVIGDKISEIEPNTINEPVETMIRRLELKGLDLVFIVTSPKTANVNEALYNKQITPVPIDDSTIADLRGPALDRYSLSLSGTGANTGGIDTLKTRTVIVANKYVADADVKKITAAVVDKFDQLSDGDRGDDQSRLHDLAIQSPGIPLHSAAEAVYKERGILPSVDFNWVSWSNSLITLGIAIPTLATLLAGIWPRLIATRIDRRIAQIDIAPIRKRQLKNCARCKDTFALRFTPITSRKFWPTVCFRMSPAKWRESDSLIERRIAAARENLTCKFAKNILISESLGNGDAKVFSPATKNAELQQALVNGELDTRQFDFLSGLIESPHQQDYSTDSARAGNPR